MEFCRYVIDDGTDWSAAQDQVAAIAKMGPGERRKGMSTIMSVKGTPGVATKRKAADDDEKKEKKSNTRRGGKKAKH